MKVTLSFDNGPDAATTPVVLDVLRRHGVQASFFVIGEKLREPALLELCRQAHAEGHWIGNHTFSHSEPLGLIQDSRAALDEIARTQEHLGLLAHPEKLFRPFGGEGYLDSRLLNRRVLDFLIAEYYSCVLWNVVPRDWENPEGWVDVALLQISEHEWPLVVLHDLPTGAMHHLDRFLQRLADHSTEIVQDFPPDCVPIRHGKVILPIDAYLADAS